MRSRETPDSRGVSLTYGVAMGTGESSATRYLVEWYRPTISDEPLDASIARLIDCAASASASGAQVHLLATLAVANDETVFAVFEALEESAVADVCRMAGCPAHRQTAAVDARFWSEA